MSLSISINSDVLAAERWDIDCRRRSTSRVEKRTLDFGTLISPSGVSEWITNKATHDPVWSQYRYFDAVPASKPPRWWYYTFMPQFAPKVRRRTKKRTIRPHRKDGRRPKAGDRVSLREWTGRPYASKQRVLHESTITDVLDVTITSVTVEFDGEPLSALAAEGFAQDDGFESFQQMIEFFHSEHGLPFTGVLIEWE